MYSLPKWQKINKRSGETDLSIEIDLSLAKLKGTPRAFDALIAERRYLAAVTRLDKAIGAMFRWVSACMFVWVHAFALLVERV